MARSGLISWPILAMGLTRHMQLLHCSRRKSLRLTARASPWPDLMGGDEVYPTASQETYQRQLRDPLAGPSRIPTLVSSRGRRFMRYQVITTGMMGSSPFLALFSRKEHLHLGGWRSHQRRSYFALQLTPNWWVWQWTRQLAMTSISPEKDYPRSNRERHVGQRCRWGRHCRTFGGHLYASSR